MSELKKTKKGQPVVKGRFQSKLTEQDMQWIRDNADADYEFLEYELKKRLRARGVLYPQSGRMIYRNIEKALSS